MKHQKITSIVATIAIVASIVMVFGANQIDVIAEEKEQYPSANDIKIETDFKLRDGVESAAFQVFIQKEGFDRQSDSPQFQLIGVVDGDRPLLYQMADITHVRGKSDSQITSTYFDIDVHLVKDGIPLRTFNYEDCRIKDYKVTTDYDKEEGWFGKGFAILDDFTIQCNGYAPKNVLLEYMNSEPAAPVKTVSTMYLKEQPDYKSHPKFQNQK